ncbi:MAG TPA: hypothetical protein VHG32_12815 [Thermoanaerobaculia bacterium]|jgi:hypothetical protein|nr:hypothetical protein [Thermoanaerobaculia bacterium]
MAPGNEFRFALEDKAYPLWILRKYQEKTNRSDRAALEYIIERWAMLEPDAATYGITLEDFQRDISPHADVVPIKRNGQSSTKG